MVGTDEPPPVVFVRKRVLDVLQVVVRWQVELITGRDVIMHKLCAIFNHTEALIRVVLLARLDVDEVLLDVVLHSFQLLLLFHLFLQLLVVTVDA